jgi:hypothetical protein
LNASVIGPLIAGVQARGAAHTWRLMSSVEPRANGLGWHSLNLSGRRWTGKTYGESDVEVWDDGTITLFADAMSTNINPQDRDRLFVRLETVVGLVRCMVQLAGAIGAGSATPGIGSWRSG